MLVLGSISYFSDSPSSLISHFRYHASHASFQGLLGGERLVQRSHVLVESEKVPGEDAGGARKQAA